MLSQNDRQLHYSGHRPTPTRVTFRTRCRNGRICGSEGGKYEIASGRAGQRPKAEFTQAMLFDSGTNYPGEPPGQGDRAADEIVNARFNVPLGVTADW